MGSGDGAHLTNRNQTDDKNYVYVQVLPLLLELGHCPYVGAGRQATYLCGVSRPLPELPGGQEG